jgi:hypothetical protein
MVRPLLALPLDMVVEDPNTFLRGWANLYRYDRSSIRFRNSRSPRDRLALFIGKRHHRGRGRPVRGRLPLDRLPRAVQPEGNCHRAYGQQAMADKPNAAGERRW